MVFLNSYFRWVSHSSSIYEVFKILFDNLINLGRILGKILLKNLSGLLLTFIQVTKGESIYQLFAAKNNNNALPWISLIFNK